jgi:hypothetical protein
MVKTLTAAIALSAFISVPVTAQPTKMSDTQLDRVVAGWVDNCGRYVVCGNNGWGNGADDINPGSFSGATAPSKGTNSSIPGGGINENPTTSTGR